MVAPGVEHSRVIRCVTPKVPGAGKALGIAVSWVGEPVIGTVLMWSLSFQRAHSPALAITIRAVVMVGIVDRTQLPVAPCDNRRGSEATLLEQVLANASPGCCFTANIDAPIARRKLHGASRRLQCRVGLGWIRTTMQPGDVELRGSR